MAKTANGTAIGQDWYTQESSLNFTDGVSYVGQNESEHYVYCLKFKTPVFSGKSEKINLGLSMRKLANSPVVLRWALCTSGRNCADYRWTSGAVEDDSKIASGYQSFTLSDSYSVCNIEIATDELKGNTEYYLYLWAYRNYTLSYVNTHDKHSISLTYKSSGGVRITTSAAQNKLHAAVIYANGAWKRYIPVVYTSSGWKRQC